MTAEAFELLDADGESVFSERVGFPAWMAHGACASSGHRTEEFMSEETSDGEQIDAITEKVIGAKFICALCPVRPACLAWAFEFETTYGFRSGTFGGLCPSERTFASQAEDPVAFGLAILDGQVEIGLIATPIPHYVKEVTLASST